MSVKESEIQSFYNAQADAVVAKDFDTLKAMRLGDYIANSPSSRSGGLSEWENDIRLDAEGVVYTHCVYTIDKLTIFENEAIVYLTRRCAGIKSDKVKFNSEVRLRDELTNNGKVWKIRSSEAITRSRLDNGKPVSSESIPRSLAMLQGCGDIND